MILLLLVFEDDNRPALCRIRVESGSMGAETEAGAAGAPEGRP